MDGFGPWPDLTVQRVVLSSAPVVALDVVVRDASGRVLLCRRHARPALGSWCVPGGQVFKNELLADAFKRLSRAELGVEFSIHQARFIGVFEHMHPDSVFTSNSLSGPDRITTHYVVNAFELDLPEGVELVCRPSSEWQWFTVNALVEHPEVHLFTRWYFQSHKGYRAG